MYFCGRQGRGNRADSYARPSSLADAALSKSSVSTVSADSKEGHFPSQLKFDIDQRHI